MATGLLIVLSVATLATAGALATRPRSAVDLALTAALVAFGWLVAVAVVLSAFAAFQTIWLAVSSTAAAVVSVLAASRAGALPLRFSWREGLADGRRAVSEPRLAVLGVVVATSLAYALALALLTPAAEIDAISYHLTRAAFWVQQGTIGPVAGSQDVRIDESPPGATVLVAVTMLVSGSVRFAGLVQWLSALVLICAVAGIARRLGAERRPAWFAGLLVAPLPSIALQVPTGMNDVVVASLVAVAVYFLLGDRMTDAVLAGAVAALLLLTKMTALVALPVLLLVALVAAPRRLRVPRVASLAVGSALGAIWILAQHSALGAGAVGGVSTSYGGSLDIVMTVGRWMLLTTQLLELPGAVGVDALLYVAAAGLLAVVGLARPASRRPLLVAAAMVAATPLLVLVADLASQSHRKIWVELGRPDIALIGIGRSVTAATSTGAWSGAVGLAVTSLGVAICLRGSTWRSTPALGLLAAAPLIWIVGFGAAIAYSPDEGRYVAPGIVLGAAATAPLLHRPVVAWWAITITAVTLLLIWTHSVERPAGIRLLSGPAPASVWTRDDAVALGPTRALPEAIRFARSAIPRDARLAIWPAPFPDPPTSDPVALLPLPFFGSGLTRHLVYARSLDEGRDRGADWALFPRYLTAGCQAGWRRETPPSAAYQAFRRDHAVRCFASAP